jgi:hypothetical protein
MRSKLIAAMTAVVAIAVFGGLLGGCAAPRNALSTHNSACFRVYPEAAAAVRRHGHFAGAQFVAPNELIIELKHVAVPDALQDASRAATCLVAFNGHFSVSGVERGWSPSGRPGRVAIVVILQRNLSVVATVVLGGIPPRLVFAHVFPKLR